MVWKYWNSYRNPNFPTISAALRATFVATSFIAPIRVERQLASFQKKSKSLALQIGLGRNFANVDKMITALDYVQLNFFFFWPFFWI